MWKVLSCSAWRTARDFSNRSERQSKKQHNTQYTSNTYTDEGVAAEMHSDVIVTRQYSTTVLQIVSV